MWMKANLVNWSLLNDGSAGVTAGYTYTYALLRVVVQGPEEQGQSQAIYAAAGGLMNHERKKTDPVPAVDWMTNEENTHRSHHRDWSDNSRSKPPVPGRELPVREASIASRRY